MVCGEAADTPVHVLLMCPCLYGPRLRLLGNIVATERDLSNDDVVAAFTAGYTAYRAALQRLPRRPGGDRGEQQQQQQLARRQQVQLRQHTVAQLRDRAELASCLQRYEALEQTVGGRVELARAQQAVSEWRAGQQGRPAALLSPPGTDSLC